jgi:hypothetical protein
LEKNESRALKEVENKRNRRRNRALGENDSMGNRKETGH